jgi:hypothetical protein
MAVVVGMYFVLGGASTHQLKNHTLFEPTVLTALF